MEAEQEQRPAEELAAARLRRGGSMGEGVGLWARARARARARVRLGLGLGLGLGPTLALTLTLALARAPSPRALWTSISLYLPHISHISPYLPRAL